MIVIILSRCVMMIKYMFIIIIYITIVIYALFRDVTDLPDNDQVDY
jgi:hypothetical protein